MPSILIPISPAGPALDIGISVPASITAPGAAPNVQWFKAIADTGCSHTAVHSSVAAACGLNIIGKSMATTPAGAIAINNYHGDLYFKSMVSWTIPFDWAFNDRTFGEMLHKILILIYYLEWIF